MLSVSDLVSSENQRGVLSPQRTRSKSGGRCSPEHQAQTDLKVAQLVRRVITTAYETCDGEPTLWCFCKPTALTSQLNSAFQSVNALAYNMIIDISLHENELVGQA